LVGKGMIENEENENKTAETNLNNSFTSGHQ
jgi:hypothetical protein